MIDLTSSYLFSYGLCLSSFCLTAIWQMEITKGNIMKDNLIQHRVKGSNMMALLESVGGTVMPGGGHIAFPGSSRKAGKRAVTKAFELLKVLESRGCSCCGYGDIWGTRPHTEEDAREVAAKLYRNMGRHSDAWWDWIALVRVYSREEMKALKPSFFKHYDCDVY